MGRKSIRVLLEGSVKRLGIRKVFFLPVRKYIGDPNHLCFSASEPSSLLFALPGSILVISAGAATNLLGAGEWKRCLAWMREKDFSCIAFADDQEPPVEMKRFCEENNIALFSSSFDEPYLLSRITGLIREKILKTVVIHGVLVNLYGLGLLITGNAGVGKTTCGLALARRGHVWIADDLIEVVKKQRKLYGRGYGLSGSVIALRDEGIVECRSYPGISRLAAVSPLQLWCELRTEPETVETEEMRTIMDVSLPFSVFSSYAEDTPTLIEEWAQGFTAPKELS